MVFVGFLTGVALLASPSTGWAQSAPTVAAPTLASPTTKGKHSRSVAGTPLDTIMSTRLTARIPPAKDFVRDSRPDPKALDYTPLSGEVPEPVRPALRDKANIEALQAELEHDGAMNERKAKALGGTHKPKRAQAAR